MGPAATLAQQFFNSSSLPTHFLAQKQHDPGGEGSGNWPGGQVGLGGHVLHRTRAQSVRAPEFTMVLPTAAMAAVTSLPPVGVFGLVQHQQGALIDVGGFGVSQVALSLSGRKHSERVPQLVPGVQTPLVMVGGVALSPA
jgi:hypothetical protein